VLLRSRLLVAGGLIVLLFTATACGGSEHGTNGAADSPHAKKSSAGQQHSSSGAAEQKPDLSGIPRVVARVNDHNITRPEFVQTYTAELKQAAAQGQSAGSIDQNQLKKQAANSLVGTELLVQEAHHKGMTVSKKDIGRTLQRDAQQNGMKSTGQLMAALKKQGMSPQQVRSQVSDQLLTSQVVSAEAGNTTPTRQELKTFYDQLVARQKQQAGGKKTADIPPFAKVKPQLEQQVKSQKQAAAAQRLVQRLRKHAHVTVNL